MAAVIPIGGIATPPLPLPIASGPAAPAGVSGATSFADLLTAGLREVDVKVGHADATVQAFAEGQAIPVHQVTLALEQARLAVELSTQIRTRLIETYREFMAMQV